MSSARASSLKILIKDVQHKRKLSETPKENNLLITQSFMTPISARKSIKFTKENITQNIESKSATQSPLHSLGRNSSRHSARSTFRPSTRSNFGVPLKQEKKFDLNDYVVLEENYLELNKQIKTFYQQISAQLNEVGTSELKEYLESLGDIDFKQKEAKDLIPIIEETFSVIIKFYRELGQECFHLKRNPKMQDNSEQAKDYIFLLQSQEAEIRTLTRVKQIQFVNSLINRKKEILKITIQIINFLLIKQENQQLKISLSVGQGKLKNSEKQGDLLATHALKEMESLKSEFAYAISELKQREDDIEFLYKELALKDSQMQSLDERLLSVYILEHKIRALGSKSAKDIQQTVFDYTEKLKEIDNSTREALRKERIESDGKYSGYKGKINQLTQENRKLVFQNTHRVQQLNQILLEKEIRLQNKVSKLQDCREKLALRNKELFFFSNKKDTYGVPGLFEIQKQLDAKLQIQEQNKTKSIH